MRLVLRLQVHQLLNNPDADPEGLQSLAAQISQASDQGEEPEWWVRVLTSNRPVTLATLCRERVSCGGP